MAKIGTLDVSAQGFGSMGLSHVYGQADDAGSIRTIHRAIELGITFFDTATGYGDGHNEELLGKAVAGHRDKIVIASKFTHRQGSDGRQVTAREAVDASLRRLNVEQIDLYYLHRVDTVVPIEESIGQLARLREAGKIGAIGVSEASGIAERIFPVDPRCGSRNPADRARTGDRLRRL
jgi:aryl-alcohol dehydrogenase-like predicted oxidoreductase